MENPTDQPIPQADPDRDNQLVRLDAGGWISGPCLDAGKLEPPTEQPAEAGSSWPADPRR